MRGWWPICVSLTALLLLVGCGRSDRPALYPATGTVTYEGKPLAGASVTFFPESGMVAVGSTDDAGNFSLKTQGVAGASAGSFRVVVTAVEQSRSMTAEEMEKLSDAERKKIFKSLIPIKYGDPNASELTASVSADRPNEFTFTLVK